MTDFNANAYSQIVAKSWSDPAYKAELLKDPRKVLAASGIHIHPSVTVHVTEGTGPSKLEFSLPPKPAGIDAATLQHVVDPNGCCSTF